MEQAGFIVSVDIGTSKIVGVLGRKNAEGIVTILASESIPSDSSVRYGVIFNTKEVAGKVKKLVSLLENKTGKKIGRVYVSVAGKSLRAIEQIEEKQFEIPSNVSFLELDKLEQKAKLRKPEFYTSYSVMAPEYFLDGEPENDPIDKTATNIKGRYRLVFGRPNIKNNLTKSITEGNRLDVAGFIVGPIACGALVLEEADREAGCALIDFGAGTTTVSIYKDGMLRYMSVIPFGGRSITRDIQALGFGKEAAENYKINYGSLGRAKSKEDGRKSNAELDIRKLNKIIQLRQDEIILNVMNQIKESGYGNDLKGGTILIGGASRMAGLDEYLSQKMNTPVKLGLPRRGYVNNAADLVQNPLYTQVLGLMLFANENCERVEPIQVKPVIQPEVKRVEVREEVKPKAEEKKDPKKQKSLFDLWGKIQNFGGAMFKDEE